MMTVTVDETGRECFSFSIGDGFVRERCERTHITDAIVNDANTCCKGRKTGAVNHVYVGDEMCGGKCHGFVFPDVSHQGVCAKVGRVIQQNHCLIFIDVSDDDGSKTYPAACVSNRFTRLDNAPAKTVFCCFSIIQLACCNGFREGGFLHQFFGVECLIPCI